MILRPGNLGGFQGMVPRNGNINPSQLGDFSGGKSDYEPPPAPPPPAIATPAQLRTIQLSPTVSYKQDTRCPQGELMETVPCTGAACDPGEMENDCVDDARYEKLMDQVEDEEGVAKAAAPQEQGGGASDALAAELEQLEAEHAQVDQMVTQTPIMMPPGAYTGGDIPSGLPSRARKKVLTSEDKIAAMVSAHETRKAVERSSAPASVVMTSLPPVSSPAPPVVAPPAPKQTIGGMFSWLKNALFGAPRSLDGLGDETGRTTTIIIPLIVGLGLLLVLRRQRA